MAGRREVALLTGEDDRCQEQQHQRGPHPPLTEGTRRFLLPLMDVPFHEITVVSTLLPRSLVSRTEREAKRRGWEFLTRGGSLYGEITSEFSLPPLPVTGDEVIGDQRSRAPSTGSLVSLGEIWGRMSLQGRGP